MTADPFPLGPAPLTDACGTVHAPAGAGARIVSLVPSLTETLFALGLGPQVVGRTHYCIHPAEKVAAMPSVGGTKKLRFERLLALAPSHVLVNIDENPRELAERIADAGITVVVTHPQDPADNPPLYRLLGHLFGRKAVAEALVARFERAYRDLAAAVAARPQRTVLVPIWRDPWMTASHDTYLSRTLALAGWRTLGHDPARRYPELTLTPELLAAAELILFPSEPYRFTAADLTAFAAEWTPHLAPHPLPPLRLIDGEALSWYGVRAIAGLETLRRLGEEVG